MMKGKKPGQYFALIIGIFFFLCGVMGFIPAFVTEPTVTPDTAGLGFTSGYGYLLGLFPINLLHNVVHLVVGLLGIVASTSLDSSRLYSGVLKTCYGAITIMGLIPATQST